MASSPEEAPLARGSVSGSENALILPDRPRGSSNSRALKIAGLTTLACLLLASQVFTAYMVFGQRQQIHALQKNSDKMGRQLTRAPQAGAPMRMHLPMNSLPLLTDFNSFEDSKKTKDTKTPKPDPVVSVEKQVQELMQDSSLPHFNETFQVNLQSLKHQMNESEWQSFETWMRYWLIFHMAQQQPARPTVQSAVIKTKCQTEAEQGHGKVGSFRPQCDEQGNYKPVQCWRATGFCWCVDASGATIEGTATRGYPDCQRGTAPRRTMYSPRLMQKTISLDDKQGGK